VRISIHGPQQNPKLLPLFSDPSSSLHSPQRRRGTQEEAAFLAAAAATSLRLSPLANTEEDGESAVLREGGVEEGQVDEGGGRDPGEVHQGARRRVMEIAAQECWAAAVREELQAAVDQLPEGGSQEGEHLGGGGGDDHQAPRHPWQQVRLYQTLCSSPPTAWNLCADSILCFFYYSCIRRNLVALNICRTAS